MPHHILRHLPIYSSKCQTAITSIHINPDTTIDNVLSPCNQSKVHLKTFCPLLFLYFSRSISKNCRKQYIVIETDYQVQCQLFYAITRFNMMAVWYTLQFSLHSSKITFPNIIRQTLKTLKIGKKF